MLRGSFGMTFRFLWVRREVALDSWMVGNEIVFRRLLSGPSTRGPFVPQGKLFAPKKMFVSQVQNHAVGLVSFRLLQSGPSTWGPFVPQGQLFAQDDKGGGLIFS